jgi:uncharacterized membrane protein YhaH (DUF805 family)
MQNMSPIGWALRPLKRYAEFSGRSSRAEFWWFVLGMIVIFVLMWFVMFGALAGLGTSNSQPGAGMLAMFGFGGLLMAVFGLLLIIPSIAVQVRRLHDTDRSGWWLGGYYILYAVYLAMMLGSLSTIMGAQMRGETPVQPSSGMFGASMLLSLLLFIYFIALLVFYCLPGTKGTNRFGDDPYGADVGEVFA